VAVAGYDIQGDVVVLSKRLDDLRAAMMFRSVGLPEPAEIMSEAEMRQQECDKPRRGSSPNPGEDLRRERSRENGWG
jgi:hypothetical protein